MSIADKADSETPTVDEGLEAARELGQRLSEVRELRGLSQRELARQINLTASTISRLESGAWDELGAPVYLRGYVDGIARVLGVDCSSAEAYFTSRTRPVATAEQSEFLMPPRPSAFYQSHRLLAYVAATALLAIPATWLVIGAFDGEIRSPSGSTLASRTTPGQPENNTELGQTGTETTVTRQQPRLASISSLPELRRDTPVLAPAPLQPPPMLNLTFTEEAWLEVNDSDGKRLAYGLMAAGSKRSFDTERGLNIRLGNADAVVAFLGEAVFALEPHSSDELAEFSLPAQ